MNNSNTLNLYSLFREDKAFLLYCLSTAFIIIFSIYAMKEWSLLVKRPIIMIACCVPWVIIFFKTFKNWFLDHTLRKIIILIGLLAVLSFVNVVFSDNQLASIKGLGLFFMSGIMIFAASLFLLNTKPKQNVFFWLCTIILLMLCILGLYEFVAFALKDGIKIYAEYPVFLVYDNPLPAGSMLAMLSVGPLFLLIRVKHQGEKYFLSACLGMAVGVIFMIGERGPLLSIIVMLLSFGLFNKQMIRILCGVVLIGGGVFYFKESLPILHQDKFKYWGGLTYRLEAYPVAFKIFKEKPIYGIGYNTPATKYLPMDYVPIIHLHEPWSKTYNSFYRGFMGSNGVLDNIFLTFLVEMGGPFFLLYFGSLFYLILFARRVGEKNKYFRPEMILFFVFLSGFLVNAMVFDILKYPSHNWIFHSILGVLFVQSIEGNRVLRKDVADNRNSGDCLSTCV